MIYDCNKQKTFRSKYIIRNIRSRWAYKRYDKNNIGQGNSLLIKDRWD